MIRMLSRERVSADAIPAGVPAGTVIAHKGGSVTRIHHDAAIVYAPQPYVLVVLVRGIDELNKSAAVIAAISKAIYQAQKQP